MKFWRFVQILFFLGVAAVGLVVAVMIANADDTTLFDRMQLPDGDPNKLNYYIQPAPNGNEKVPFTTIFDPASVYLSLVVPAYNEEKRLPKMLDETLNYLKSREEKDKSFTWEIVIVNDGSKDKTKEVVLNYAKEYPNIFLLNQPVNMGKGAAIQAGCLHVRGELVLMLDADGATKIDDFEVLEKEIKSLMKTTNQAIVIGSRAQNEKAKRTPLRKFLSIGMHTLIVLSGVHGIRDTQCGFKLFTRESCKMIFMNQHVQRWCCDPEILVIARRLGMKISELPVEWNEIDGSKMKISGMIKMATDLIKIAIFHRVGAWKIRDRRH